ncbi:1,2-dihydroxy-3-keto-5-methylthiopentene dioxygenase [Marasmius crinis-equi]|uniref:1,2-dihydroxy-3-keto-5-methylthiopentene dioxygenase n=1 Tax=Marasmius crinis-equi TaxID=585013 RepID=A0ABR3F7Q9_9AGAR
MSSATLRAYYRNASGDFSLPQDTGRPVPEEKLRALGVKWWVVEGTEDERMKTLRQLSQDLGFTGCEFEHLFDLRKQTGTPYQLDMVRRSSARLSSELCCH